MSDGKFGGNSGVQRQREREFTDVLTAAACTGPAAAAADRTTEIPFDFGWRMTNKD